MMIRCQLGMHRWEPSPDSGRRCARPGCDATRPGMFVFPTETPPIPDHDRHADVWVVCTRWNGDLIYEGPVPVPHDLDRLSTEDCRLRRFNHYEFTYLDLAPGEPAR